MVSVLVQVIVIEQFVITSVANAVSVVVAISAVVSLSNAWVMVICTVCPLIHRQMRISVVLNNAVRLVMAIMVWCEVLNVRLDMMLNMMLNIKVNMVVSVMIDMMVIMMQIVMIFVVNNDWMINHLDVVANDWMVNHLDMMVNTMVGNVVLSTIERKRLVRSIGLLVLMSCLRLDLMMEVLVLCCDIMKYFLSAMIVNIMIVNVSVSIVVCNGVPLVMIVEVMRLKVASILMRIVMLLVITVWCVVFVLLQEVWLMMSLIKVKLMISIVVAIIMVTGRVLFVMMRDRVAFSVVKNIFMLGQIRLEERQDVDITVVLHNLMMVVLIWCFIVINNLIKSVMGAVWSLMMQSTMLVCPKKLFVARNSWHVVSVFLSLNAMNIVADLVMWHTIMFYKASIKGRVSVLIRRLIQV